MVSSTEEQVKQWYNKFCYTNKIAADIFDINAEIDTNITTEENITILEEKLNTLKEQIINAETKQEAEIMQRLSNIEPKTIKFPVIEARDTIKVMVIYGNTGAGKTAFSFKALEAFRNIKPVYIFRHSNKKLIETMGYNVMQSLSEFNKLNNIVLYIDEPQLFFEKYEKRSNEVFIKLCSLARQKDITLIFSTSDTRWINKGLESYVTHWIIKDIDPKLIKNGSIAKKIIREMVLVYDEFSLEIDEFLFYCRDKNLNGQYKFTKPIYFDDRLSKSFKQGNIK